MTHSNPIHHSLTSSSNTYICSDTPKPPEQHQSRDNRTVCRGAIQQRKNIAVTVSDTVASTITPSALIQNTGILPDCEKLIAR